MWVAWRSGSFLFNAHVFLSVSEILNQPTTKSKSPFRSILSPFLLLIIEKRSAYRVSEAEFS